VGSSLDDWSAVPFAVVDVETTGFSPRLNDRVVEVAVVRLRANGEIQDQYCTLVNPQRDVGPTHIHGITASDVRDAPVFSEVIGDIAARLDGAVMVAHNAPFDIRFVSAEFERAGFPLPAVPTMCTLRLAYRLEPKLPSRRLADCCASMGVSMGSWHSAGDDAQATAHLFLAYLQLAESHGLHRLADLGCDPLVPPPSGWAVVPPSGRSLSRSRAAADRREEATYLSRLVSRMDVHGVDDPNVANYLHVLDRALDDRRVSADEGRELMMIAGEWGLSRSQVLEAHRGYLSSLVHAAMLDGVLSPMEREDLEAIRTLLGLDTVVLEELLSHDGNQTLEPWAVSGKQSMAGLSVCFTGQLLGTLGGEPITRSRAEELAREAGMIVLPSVTKKLDVLVVADPDTASGKAEKARAYETRIIAEAAFWQAIGVQPD
jgi:DNA polymerase-3 subunit epsilon